MASFIHKKNILLSVLLSVSSLSHANSSHNIYMMTLSIMSYVKWSTQTPILCTLDDPDTTELFTKTINQQKNPTKVKAISSQQFTTQKCDAVFFSQTTPLLEEKLITSAFSPPVLSFSKSNVDCEIGSIFCLYTTKSNNTQFRVNLDSLAKAKIHIDPRVLLLAQRSE